MTTTRNATFSAWSFLRGLILVFTLFSATLLAGCDTNDDSNGKKDKKAEDESVTIQVAAAVGDEDAACGTEYTGLGSASSTIEIGDLRFYVSNIHLIDDSDEEVELELDQTDWQTESVALLDFEDASGLCATTGTAETNTVITGTVAGGDYTGIAFDLGVPFDLNHTDTTTAPSPLNNEAMAWGWQYGRKFVRIDLHNPDNAEGEQDWYIHLGSTGCVADSSDQAPVEACSNVNLASVHSHDFDAGSGTVTVDLAALLDGVDLSVQSGGAPGCMSGTDDGDCPVLFENFGLDLATGECADECHDQTVFSF